MGLDTLLLLLALFSSVSFAILLLPRWQLRLLVFSPLAAIPPALLVYVFTRGHAQGYDGFFYLIVSLLLSGTFMLVGCGLIFRARGQTKGALVATTLSAAAAASPLLLPAGAFVLPLVRRAFCQALEAIK